MDNPTPEDIAKMGADMLAESAPPSFPGNGQPETPPNPVAAPPPAALPPQEVKISVEQSKAAARRAPRKTEPKEPMIPGLPATAKGQIDKILPDAVKMRFRKRDEMGEMHMIKDYDAEALKATGYDVESFIQKYLIANYGEGKYVVQAINSKGQVAREREYSVLNPAKTPPVAAQGGGGMPQEFLDRMWHRMERLEKEAAQQPQQPQPDPLTMMQRYKEVLGGQGNEMMPMMMMMMQQQQQQQNPVSAELASLKDDLKRAATAATAPLPMLPPPPTDAITGKDLIEAMNQNKGPGMGEILTAVTALLPAVKEIFGGSQGQSAEIQRLRDEVRNEKMSALINEIREIKERPSRTFTDTIQEMQMFAQAAQQFAGGSEPNFWSVAEAAVQNIPETTAGLGAIVERMKENESSRRPPQQIPAPAAQEAPPPGPPVFPDGFREACRRIEEATDDIERVEAIIESLKVLATGPKYRPIVMKMLTQARRGERDVLRASLETYLGELAQYEMLTTEGAAKAAACIDEYLDETMAMIGGGTEQRSNLADEDTPAVAPEPDEGSPGDPGDVGEEPEEEQESPDEEPEEA